MNKVKLYILPAVLAMIMAAVAVSCATMKNGGEKDVDYIVADHYFVKNDVATLPNGIITSEEQFRSYFGEATVMGPYGRPTVINFKNQFAIAVCVPETDRDTSIDPVRLKRTATNLVLTYRVKQGEKRSYTIQPLMLLVVDKKYEAPLEMQRQ